MLWFVLAARLGQESESAMIWSNSWAGIGGTGIANAGWTKFRALHPGNQLETNELEELIQDEMRYRDKQLLRLRGGLHRNCRSQRVHSRRFPRRTQQLHSEQQKAALAWWPAHASMGLHRTRLKEKLTAKIAKNPKTEENRTEASSSALSAFLCSASIFGCSRGNWNPSRPAGTRLKTWTISSSDCATKICRISFAPPAGTLSCSMKRTSSPPTSSPGQRKGSVGFALAAIQRRLASSPEAIFQSLKRRRERLQRRLREEKISSCGSQILAETVAPPPPPSAFSHLEPPSHPPLPEIPEDDDDLTAEEQEGTNTGKVCKVCS
jgi:hypothetical protein